MGSSGLNAAVAASAGRSDDQTSLPSVCLRCHSAVAAGKGQGKVLLDQPALLDRDRSHTAALTTRMVTMHIWGGGGNALIRQRGWGIRGRRRVAIR